MGAQGRLALAGLAALGALGAYLALSKAPSSSLPSGTEQSPNSPLPVPKPPHTTTVDEAPTASPTSTGVATDSETPVPELPAYRGPERNAQRAALIREALIARKAVQSGASMPERQGTGNQADKPLGEYVARTMREQFIPLATECYETLLATTPHAAGNVALEFSVLGDPAVGGVVVDVTLGKDTTLSNDTFRSCMTESMYAVVFDAPPGKDGSVSVKQSFELSPE